MNRAAAHPDRTLAVYLDNAVCDFKSWPGGEVFVSPVVYGVLEGWGEHVPPNMQKNRQLGLCVLAAIAAPVLGGAWAGAAVHKVVAGVMKNGQRGRSPNLKCGSKRGWDGGRCRFCGATSTGVPITDPPEAGPEKRVIGCEKCGQKLRVPVLSAELEVTCNSCKHKFGCKPLPCPGCGSSSGWNGRRCPWCGFFA
jgi:hypothetical protein